MEKISKLCGMLVLGLAGAIFAANPFSYKCASSEVPPVEDESGIVGNIYYDFDCSISQSSAPKEELQENEFSTWDELLESIHGHVKELSLNGFIGTINVKLETDIQFDPLPSDGSACTNSTSGGYSLYFSGMGNAQNHFDGQHHTISNFCVIGQGDQNGYGFFKQFRNGSIKNVTFDNAFVMAKLGASPYEKKSMAAVVVVSAENVEFDSVVVTNSKVYGTDVGSIAASAKNGSFKKITVSNTDVAIHEDVFPSYETAEVYPEVITASSALGGVVGSAEDVSFFKHMSLSGVQVGVNNVKFLEIGVQKDPQSLINRSVGGVVGSFSAGRADNYYVSFDSSSVRVVLGQGRFMGGVVGSLSQSKSLLVQKVFVRDSVVPSCEEEFRIGGVVGSANSGNNNLDFMNNDVALKMKWESFEGCSKLQGSVRVGGLLGEGQDILTQYDVYYDTVAVDLLFSYEQAGQNHVFGGVFGYAENTSLRLVDNVVRTTIKDESTPSGQTSMGGILGEIVGTSEGRKGSLIQTVGFYRNDVQSDLKVSVTDAANVGGLAGKIAHGNAELEFFHNVIKGDIEVAAATGVLAGFGVGYLTASDSITAAGNFHIGTKDKNVSSFAGRYTDDAGTDKFKDGFADRNTYPEICYNYRNAVDGLEPTDGDWLWGTTGEIRSLAKYFFNGILSDSAMKTTAFAYALNAGVYRKRGGGSNDAIVLNKSWWSDGKDYPRYVDDIRLTPYAPNMLTVDYSRVADQMTATQKVAMAPYMDPNAEYQFVAFSSSEGKLSPDFIAALNALDWDYVMDRVLLKDSILENDRQYTMYEDREFVVSYWIDDETSSYELEEGGDSQILFCTPKISKIRLSDVNKLIPHIQVKSGTTEYYRLNGFAFNCLDASVCGNDPFEFSPNYSVTAPFEKELSWLLNEDLTGYSDTLRVIYKSMSKNPYVSALPYVYFANAQSSVRVYAQPYAYTSSGKKETLTDSIASASPTDLSHADMTSEFGIRTGKSLALTDWTVDLWVGFEENYTAKNINGCYGESPLGFCTSDKVIAAKADRYIGTVDGLVDSIRRNSSDNLWKWTISLKADESIVMDSLILAFSKVANNGFSSPVVYAHITPKGDYADYTITFVPNNGTNIFFGDSWKREGVHSLASKETASLPPIYSSEDIFRGWSTEYDSENAKVPTNELTEDVLDVAVIDKDNGFKMYSHWENESPELRQIYLEIANEGMETLNGTLSLEQSYYDKDREEDVPIPHTFEEFYQDKEGLLRSSLNIPAIDEPMTFRVKVEPNPGYKLDSLAWRFEKLPELMAPAYMAKAPDVFPEDKYGLVMGADTTFRVEAYVSSGPTEHYLVAKFAPVPYHFTFTRELGEEWFYAKDWRDTAIYTIDAFGSGQSEFPRLYSVKGWTEGWYSRLGEGYDCSPTFDHDVNCMETGAYREDDTLHVSVLDNQQNNEVIFLNADAVNLVRLVQFIGSKDSPFGLDSISHSFMIAETDGEMEIPLVEDVEFEFILRISVLEGMVVDTVVLSYMMEGQDGLEPFEEFFANGDRVLLNLSRMRHVRFDAKIHKPDYQITFENPVVDDVMVDGENFDKKGYSVDSSDFSFPSMIYTNESCLLGWKLKSSEDKDGNDLVMRYFNWEDAKLMTEGENILTAVWGDGAACDIEVNDKDSLAGEYARLVLDAEGGNIQLVQMSRDEDGDIHEVRTRQFGAGKFMLFPIEFRDETWFTVKIVPDAGYDAPDSVLFYYDTKRAGEFAGAPELDSLWLKDGDNLPGNLFGSVLKVDFHLANDTPLEFASTPDFKQAGNSVRLTFATSEFAVERNALVRTVLTFDGDSTVVVDSIKEVPYEYHWSKVGLASGEYSLSVQVYDETASVSFDSVFVVNNGIEAAAMDGWQMLALSVIDKKSVDWTDTDAVFFWWDESSSVGEYWQYKSFDEKDDVDLMTGGWYSSVDGRPLKIREDIDVPDTAVWQLDSVYSGWNMVANPYGWIIVNPDTSLESFRWNSEVCDYDTTKPWYLKPYEAIWVRVGSDTTLTLDATPVFDTAAVVPPVEKRRALAKVNNAFDWSIRANLKDEMGRTDSWNVLGVGDEVKMEEPPEGMGNHVNLSILDGRKRLAKSMKRASEDGYTWNLEVSATSNRRGFLSFDGLGRLSSLGYRLFVTVDDRLVEMFEGEELPVALKSLAKSIKVQVVKSEAQLATSVSGLKMVQQGGMMNVFFNVPSDLSGRTFVAEIADLDGKKLSSSSGKASSGRNEVSMTIPKSGLYFVRIRVANQQTAGKFLAK